MIRSLLTFTCFLRLLLTVALIAPAPLANANGLISTDGLLCNPSGQSLSAEAQAQLSELEAFLSDAAGEDTPSPATPPHCDECLPPLIAVQSSLALTRSLQCVIVTSDWQSVSRLHASPRGPPLGSRAPPYPF